MNYFVEGIQGAGKSTMVRQLLKENPEYKLYMEGDYSPVELAWNAYMTRDDYKDMLEKYSQIRDEIIAKTVEEKDSEENDRKVVAYTQIITDIPGFHKDLERYEIYNGNISREEFEQIVLKRFTVWQGNKEIFECSLFQNIIENQILFYEMSDEEIVAFYHKVKQALSGKDFTIYYIEVDDVRKAEEIIRRERSDDQGNELWFPIMIAYLESSPYAQTHNLKGMDGLVEHLEHRCALEKRIIYEVFRNEANFIRRKL